MFLEWLQSIWNSIESCNCGSNRRKNRKIIFIENCVDFHIQLNQLVIDWLFDTFFAMHTISRWICDEIFSVQSFFFCEFRFACSSMSIESICPFIVVFQLTRPLFTLFYNYAREREKENNLMACGKRKWWTNEDRERRKKKLANENWNQSGNTEEKASTKWFQTIDQQFN